MLGFPNMTALADADRVAAVPPPRTEVHAPGMGTVLEVGRGGTPDGPGLVVHHGLVGGAIVGDDWHARAVAAGRSLVVPARPGYGRSDPLDMGQVAAWPALLLPVLDALRFDADVDVVAVSAGAPYALALAAALPDRVRRVGILSGVAHVADPTVLAHYGEDDRAAYARYDTAPLPDIAAGMTAALGPLVDRLGGDDPGWADALAATLAHDGFGPAREARLQVRPWGLDLDDVRQPVRWWHSRGDAEVPFSAVAATVAGLPRAELVALDGDDHIPGAAVVDDLFSWLAED